MSARHRNALLSSVVYSVYIHRWLAAPITWSLTEEGWEFLRKNPMARVDRSGKVVPRFG